VNLARLDTETARIAPRGVSGGRRRSRLSGRPYCCGVRRGINIGNGLDTDRVDRRAWRVDLAHLDVIADAGFDTVRIPVAWSKHASVDSPFEIASALFAAVDAFVDGALERDLEVVIDVHHYDELCAHPAAHRDRFLALWARIAERYAGLPPTMRFELLNEPHDQLTAERWNQLLVDALAVVRASNPDREVVVGPADRNTIAALDDLELPDDDRLVVSVHYYLPLSFTHQGARWWPRAADWVGTRWGSPTDRQAVRDSLATAAAWARRNGRRLLIGEFGTYRLAPAEDRASWTAHVRTVADELDMPWCYWDFATDFGVYNATVHEWNEPIRAALLPGLRSGCRQS
jgi:endoglucanase